jgi:GntR family transcriptional regulator
MDRASTIALHTQLAEQLKHYIGTRRIEQGHQLPSVRKLAALLGVSPVTISRAYAALQTRGLVEARPGSGIYVVDFMAAGRMAGHAEQRLQEFAEAVVAQALRIGHDPQALAAAVAEVGERLAARDPHLLVVIDEFDSVDHLVEQLSVALADDDIRVSGVHLADVEEHRETIDRAALVASAPHCYGLVRRRLPERDEDIVGLTMALSASVNQQLRQIDPRSHVIVVGTQPSFLSWMSHLVRLQVPLQADPVEVAMTDQADDLTIREAIRNADVVVFGSGLRHRLPPLIPDGKTAIELSHLPDAESINNIRTQLRRVVDRRSNAAAARR